MKCSRCGSRYPNPGCYVCAEPETHPETPDREGGSLLKTYEDNRNHRLGLLHLSGCRGRVLPLTCPTQRELMKADTARTISATAFVLCIVALVLMGAAGCRSFEAYLSAVLVAIFAAFVGSTQTPV